MVDVPLGVTVAVAVGTVLTSGITSAIVTHRLNRSKERDAMLREKIEVLFLKVEKQRRSFGRLCGTADLIVSGHWTVEQGKSKMFDELNERMISGDEITMLGWLYFPALNNAMGEAGQAYRRMIHALNNLTEIDGGVSGIEEFKAAEQNLKEKMSAFLTDIVVESFRFNDHGIRPWYHWIVPAALIR